MRALASRAVGDVLPVRVDTSAHVADLLLAVEAIAQPKAPKAGLAEALKGEAVELIVAGVFGAVLAAWLAMDPGFSKERVALGLLVLLAAVRPLLEAKIAAKPKAAEAGARVNLTLSLDEYAIEQRNDDDPSAIPPIPKRFIDG
jgi:UPF0716 family protein affecting phage T7 exclusion